MPSKVCVICANSFDAPTHRHQTCSAPCREKFRGLPRWTSKRCETCGVEFRDDKHHPKRFCTRACRDADRASTRLKTCPVCTKDYKADRAEQVYCSHDCSGKAHSGRGSRGGQVPLCICGKPIQNKGRVFCSDECQQLHQKRRSKSHPDTEHICLACGKDFTRPWFYAGKKLYCSPMCQKVSIKKESAGQVGVKEFAERVGATTQSFWLSSGKEVDVYCPEARVGFEYNGAYFHSMSGLERRGVKREEQIRYHLTKTLEAETDGIFLYHVWSWEWEGKRTRPIIESQMRILLGQAGQRIYARKTAIITVDNAEAGDFLNENHLIGRVNAHLHYGLMHQGHLVALMSFDPAADQEWILSRYCVKKDVSVVGGASRLFTHFVREHSPDIVTSYSDRAKTTGEMYERLGFRVSHVTDPEYINFHPNSGKVYRRYQTMRSALLVKHPDKLSPEMTEREMCDVLGYTRVYGCGKKVWVWERPLDSY